MKNISSKSVSVIILFISFGFYYSCSEEENDRFEEPDNINVDLTTENPKFLLDNQTSIANGLLLPSGTQWEFTDESHNEIQFYLPKGYEFLLVNEQSKEAIISDVGGGYSCTCSAENSCRTFYTEDTGYGCLHNTCTGTCTGKNKSISSGFTIKGILYTANDIIDIDSKINASLTDDAKHYLYETERFKNVVKSTYDMFYKHIERPNLDDDLTNILDSGQYVMASGYLFGSKIAIVIPNDINLEVLMRNVEISDDPTSCSCSGDSGTACKLESKGAFGYRAWWCDGCTTCTMS